MKKSGIYCAVRNNGDGSASVLFFEDRECAEVFESLETEPFAESTIRELDLNRIQTRESMIKDLEDGEYYSPEEDIQNAIKRLKKK